MRKINMADKKSVGFFLVMCLFVAAITMLVSLAYFDAKPTEIARNSVIALLVFAVIYTAWTKIHESYEKFFRLGLGR